MAEEWVKNARGETRVALDAQFEVEAELGALKEMEAYRNFNHLELFLSLKRDLAMVSDCIRCSSFKHLYFLTFYSKGEIPLVFVCVLLFFFLFLGHTVSSCGRGVGKECTW